MEFKRLKEQSYRRADMKPIRDFTQRTENKKTEINNICSQEILLALIDHSSPSTPSTKHTAAHSNLSSNIDCVQDCEPT
eukprot:scaffold60498_cov76-Cyclotella_meneghiniana.AAC.1